MIGAFLNALGILAGALWGVTWPKALTLRTQIGMKSILGAATVLAGLNLFWLGVHGPLSHALKEGMLAVLALVAGHFLGRAAGMQNLSNWMGHWAAQKLGSASRSDNKTPASGAWISAALLYCSSPLGIVGSVADGLNGDFWLFLIKAMMDGMAMMSFVQGCRWPVALAALPVLGFFDGLTLVTHGVVLPCLLAHQALDLENATAGLITCAMAPVILQVRRVALANFLPALLCAPWLAWAFN